MLKKCSKANRKLTVLSRMFQFLTFKKRRALIKAYFESQFKYCPLVWMFHGRQVNNKINRLHERALRMISEDGFSVHDRNIQQLALEMCKVAKGLAPTAISSLFLQCSNNRHTRSQSDFSIPQVYTVYFGQNSIRYLGPLIWNSVPAALRNVESFVEFKSLIKNWKPSNCPCRLCKDYIPQVGFVNLTQWLISNDKGIVTGFTLYCTAFKFCLVILDLVYIKIYFCFIVLYYSVLIDPVTFTVAFNFRIINFTYF